MKPLPPSVGWVAAFLAVLSAAAVAVAAMTFVIRTMDQHRTDDVERILHEMRSGLLCVEQQLAQHRLNTQQHHENQAETHGVPYRPEAPLPRPETLNPAACAEHHQEETP